MCILWNKEVKLMGIDKKEPELSELELWVLWEKAYVEWLYEHWFIEAEEAIVLFRILNELLSDIKTYDIQTKEGAAADIEGNYNKYHPNTYGNGNLPMYIQGFIDDLKKPVLEF